MNYLKIVERMADITCSTAVNVNMSITTIPNP